MRRCLLLLFVVPVGVWEGPAQAQSVKSPAELFPAGTVAYAEVRQPDRLAREVRSLFQGSVLDNVPESLARLQARYDPNATFFRVAEQVGMAGLLLSPEVVAEFQRLQGAAIGLTAMGKNGEPEYLAVVLPGGSQAPSFVLRAVLTSGRMRPSTRVEGVTLYQVYFGLGRGKGVPVGPAFALMPGALFVGSPDAVKEAILRAKGKGEGPSLAGLKVFQEALEEAGKDPGLFAYAKVGGLFQVVGEQIKRVKNGAQAWSVFTRLVNPRAFRAVAYSVTLRKGTLRYRKVALLDPKEKSPILELLPTTPVNTRLLHFAPQDAVLLLALSNGDSAKRWTRLLELGDRLAKLGDQKKGLPSDLVKQLEAKLELDLGKDVIAKIANIGFAVGDPLKAPVKETVEEGPDFKSVRSGPEVPIILVVQATDEEAAKQMVERVLPQVFSLMAGDKAGKPTHQEVKRHRVYTLKLGRHQAVHYGRHGNTIVLGPYQAPVARALADGAAKKGWLAEAKSAALLKDLKDPLMVGAVKPITVLMGTFMVSRTVSRASAPKLEKAPQPPQKPLPPRARGKAARARGKEGLTGLGKLLAKEEPLVLSLSRTQDRVMAEARMGGLKPLVVGLTDFLVEQAYRSYAQRKLEKGREKAPRPLDKEKLVPPSKREK